MKFICSILLLSVLFNGYLLSQQAITLTLEKSVELALQKNLSVIQAKNAVDAQSSNATTAICGLLPSVGANYSFSRSQQWKKNPGYNVINDQVVQNDGFAASNSFSTGISGQLVLFNGFANISNISRARANANASEFSFIRTRQNTILETHQLFLNVVRTYELLKVSEDNLKRSKQQLERIVESNKVGAVALADVYRQQVQAGSDELALIQAQSNYEKAKADLIAFIGIDFRYPYTFDFSGIPQSIDTTEFSNINSQYANFNDLANSAINNRPDYLATIENLNAARSSINMAWAGYSPTVSVSSSFGYNGYDNNNSFSPLFDNKGLNYNLNVSLPIFNGYSTQNQIQQAQIQKNNAEEQLKQSELQLRVDIQKALLDFDASEKQVKVTQTSVASAEMDRKIAEEKYNLGAGTLLDLLIANANYTNALSNKVNAAINYLLAKKQIEFSLGTISN
jgi:outer membrane protein